MRKIKVTEGLDVVFGHAGIEGEALTTVQIDIPIDGNKYMEGVNVIECIKERLLPNLNVDAINQQLALNEITLLNGLLINGVVSVEPDYLGAAYYYLFNVDNASLGVISFDLGANKPTYT